VCHVLEHVHDPVSLLQECYRIVKPNGLLIVDVPNFGCYDCSLFGKNWFQIDAPRHLYHFTQQTLGRMCEQAGFQIDSWKLKLPLPVYDKSSLQNCNHDKQGIVRLVGVVLRGSLGKCVRYCFGKGQRLAFSINLTAYMSKAKN
jgi:hypothetical protein